VVLPEVERGGAKPDDVGAGRRFEALAGPGEFLPAFPGGQFREVTVRVGVRAEFVAGRHPVEQAGVPGGDIGDGEERAGRVGPVERVEEELDALAADGRLVLEEADYERVPESERPGYDEELGGFETPLDELRGSQRKIHRGWRDVAYHGIFEFHSVIDEEYVSLEAKFTDRTLVAIRRSGR
jgi:hypothetical protein